MTLHLGKNHGLELGIRRESDDKWYYLVHRYAFAYTGMKNLMESAEFAEIREVHIGTDIIAYDASIAPGANERIFTTSGKYDIYTSNGLDSDEGGYKCVVDYSAEKASIK